jgi:hypothetical protein
VASGSVTIIGMKALYRDLRAVDRGLPNELKRELRQAVEPTVTLAKALAPYKKGGLRGSIRAYPSQKQISVRATKRREGFLYPAVYEYGGRGGRDYGPRAYLNPALNRTENQVVDRVARGLGDFIARHGL